MFMAFLVGLIVILIGAITVLITGIGLLISIIWYLAVPLAIGIAVLIAIKIIQNRRNNP